MGRFCRVLLVAARHASIYPEADMAMVEENGERDVRLVECPKCDGPLEVEPITVLRPGDQALQELFEGTLNVVSCEHCGVTFALRVPVLYRDDEAQYLVYNLPMESHADWREAEVQMAAVTERIFTDEPEIDEPACRLTVHRNEFIEKIALHCYGLDDRIVEYVKYQLLNHPSEDFGLDPMRHQLFFDFSQEDDENLGFLVFDRETDQATARTHLPMDAYNEIAEMLASSEKFGEELDLLFPGSYVSIERLNE